MPRNTEIWAASFMGNFMKPTFLLPRDSPIGHQPIGPSGACKQSNYIIPELLLKYDAYLDALVFAADFMNQTFVWVNENQVQSFWIQDRQFDYLGKGVERDAMKRVKLIPVILNCSIKESQSYMPNGKNDFSSTKMIMNTVANSMKKVLIAC